MSKTEKLGEGSVVEREGAGTLNLMLHPVVIINISDHWTRAKIQNKKENPRVFGALVGVQTGRDLELFNSFELPAKEENGITVINTDYLVTKQEQCKVSQLHIINLSSQKSVSSLRIHGVVFNGF